jgi:aminoglycoside 6-adenylyltransferase
MDRVSLAYEQMIENFVAWAEKEETVTSAIVIGSRARSDHPADPWADLDMIVVSKEPARLLEYTNWLTEIGRPVLTFIETTSAGDEKERRVLFDNGLDVDFSVVPYQKIEMMLQPDVFRQFTGVFGNLFGRGVRMLLDKEGQVARLSKLAAEYPSSPSMLPGEAEFLQCASDFWYHVLWTARHLRRGELWWAKAGCDIHLKSLLFTMLEWHARATQGLGHDTWFRGRFLEEWANPQAVHELKQVFAHYDAEDIWRALLATMRLFRWLAEETAVRCGLDYPAEEDRFVTTITMELFEGREMLA